MEYFKGLVYKTLIAALLLSACHNEHKEKQAKSQPSNNPGVEVFEFPIKRFSLPYDTSLKCDSNAMIFLKEASFDTSYLLHIVKSGSKIRGVCYIVPPSYHRDLQDFYEHEHQLLFFDGFSFRLNTGQWEMLKRATNEAISKMTDSSINSSVCYDCPGYSLIYDNKRRSTVSSQLREIFKNYDTFVRDSLINPLLAKRE